MQDIELNILNHINELQFENTLLHNITIEINIEEGKIAKAICL